MAKDISKLTDDNFKAQWTKENAAHDALWKVLVRIAEEYGLGFDSKGEVVFEDGANNKTKSNVPNATPMATDTTKLINEIKSVISSSIPKTDTSKLTVKLSPEIHVKNNNDVFQAVTEKWDEWLKKHNAEILRVHGVVEDICIGGEHAYKMADDVSSHEQIPWTPPKKPSAFKRFRMRLWEDVVSSFWKSFAYGLLICCTCFAGYEYYYNRKLVRIAKEYTIVRHYLEQYPDYKQRLNNIDTFLQEEDVYKVYRYMEQQKEKQ
ncbi:hypothetical protein [Candidatus Bacteroides intestinigallinarum]|jgi:hypothetical protein|uniref:hypothetical protein n=1 Tax=Candidatus Bacteroides intestinigallinarum TaxID=2838470 RepID=UPI0022E0497E|nr:hypothetical protein [Candidatus Bacteroides intestinigallinarum]